VRTSLLAEAVAVLQRRAARLDAASPERPYHLLYALHCKRGAHAAAAAAMLAWARRLQAGDPAHAATLHDVEVALGEGVFETAKILKCSHLLLPGA